MSEEIVQFSYEWMVGSSSDNPEFSEERLIVKRVGNQSETSLEMDTLSSGTKLDQPS